MIKKIAIFSAGLLFTLSAYALSASVSYGDNDGKSINGGRIAVQLPWHWHKAFTDTIVLAPYWDFSYAYWHAHGDNLMENAARHEHILAAAPIFRLTTVGLTGYNLKPYLEASVGLSILSARRFGPYDLGSNWEFQDLLGGGLSIGDKWDLGLHYLHYSNANLCPPNNGIDIKWLATVAYHF